ncbi:MAG TPA: TlpA disulfide reductase family protein [Acidimicrobiia bacterium]|nr:TlpA disulfide reductase family protein [Acidimicrobiia bacterium]
MDLGRPHALARPQALPRLRRLLGAVGVVVLVASAGAACSSGSGGSKHATADVTNPTRFDLPALTGDGRVRLADFRGKPVVVNFFASWCGPCQQELPDLAAAARQLAGRVSFVAVNSKEISASSGLALARSKGLPEAGVTLARDVGGQGGSGLHDSYDVRNAMPVNAFYAASGKLVYVAPGQLTPDRLKTQLKDLFGVTL